MSIKISQLTELLDPADADVIAIVNSGETKKVTKANLLKLVKQRITTLEERQPFKHFFEYAKATNVTIVDDTYQDIAVLDIADIEDGEYMLGVSITHSLDSTTTSAFFRWRLNGGNWNEYEREPKDKTDKVADYYAYPDEYEAGPIKVEVQIRKENANDVLLVQFIDIMFERKK